jgi:NADH-quinone oxidoreductase subunit M
MGLLSVLIFIPFVGALLVLLMKDAKAAKIIGLGTSVVTFAISLGIYARFDPAIAGFQWIEKVPWVVTPGLNLSYHVALDGMSMLLVLLTTFLMIITIIGTWNGIQKNVSGFMSLMMVLLGGMIGVFCSLDLFLFYIFWELILIPMYFIIGMWGGPRRIYAAVKFFIYTMAGSLLMLVAIIWLGVEASKVLGYFTTDLTELYAVSRALPIDVQHLLFWGFALSFAIKVPLFPLHTWLPDAHVEAPTAGSVILAGVLLKMGTYGLMRFNLPLFPQASIDYASFMCILAVIGIIYGALVSIVQTDIKKLIAYSSVSHMGFIVLGIFSMTQEGLQGALIQMINHGLSTGMLFIMFGMMYERRHTREIKDYGGLARTVPVFTVLFGIALLSSVGLPGLNGFVGEYLTIMGAFTSPILDNWAYAIFSTSGVILAAVYLLWMYQRFAFGPAPGMAVAGHGHDAHGHDAHGHDAHAGHDTHGSHHGHGHDDHHHVSDLNGRELIACIPLVIFMVWIGIQPMHFMKTSKASMDKLSGELIQGSKTGFNTAPLERAAK